VNGVNNIGTPTHNTFASERANVQKNSYLNPIAKIRVPDNSFCKSDEGKFEFASLRS
jgi:hypothetical protein